MEVSQSMFGMSALDQSTLDSTIKISQRKIKTYVGESKDLEGKTKTIQSIYKALQEQRQNASIDCQEVSFTLENKKDLDYGIIHLFRDMQIKTTYESLKNSLWQFKLWSWPGAAFMDTPIKPFINLEEGNLTENEIDEFFNEEPNLEAQLSFFIKKQNEDASFKKKITRLILTTLEQQQIAESSREKEDLEGIYRFIIVKYSEAEALKSFFRSLPNFKGDYDHWDNPSGYYDYTFTSLIDNPFLIGPKPRLAPSPPKPGDLSFYLNDTAHLDITFIVDNQEVKAHRVFFTVCPYFEKMFNENWKRNEPICFSACSHTTFTKLKHYIYTGQLQLDSIQSCLDMLQLADFLNYPALKWECENLISHLLNEENVFSIALWGSTCHAPYLIELCRWFFKKNSQSLQDIDFSNYSVQDLASLLEVLYKHYDFPLLKNSVWNHLKTSIKLDENFIVICKTIKEIKNYELREAFTQHLKETRDNETGKTLFEILRGNSPKDLWRAYKELVL